VTGAMPLGTLEIFASDIKQGANETALKLAVLGEDALEKYRFT
jgi:hypothetical protein